MENKKQKIVLLKKENYLAFVKNSKDSKMFRNCFGVVGRQKKDLLKNGDLSCAYFVSCILKIFDLIGSAHLTVEGTIEDMKKNGWHLINEPKEGSVLVWESRNLGNGSHSHIGFFIGNKKAVSNSDKERKIVEHGFTFDGKRRIKAIYWHQKFD